MVEEYEAFTKGFWAAVHEHMEGGALSLDDLEEGSPLELCYYLVSCQLVLTVCCVLLMVLIRAGMVWYN
jgi:hypothetical protein